MDMQPTSPAPRRILLVVSGHALDVAQLTAGLARLAGPCASFSCWALEVGHDEEALAAPPPTDEVRESVSFVVASSRPGLVGGLHARLARVPNLRVLDPVHDPARLLRELEARQPRLLLLDERLLERVAPRTLAALPVRVPGLRVLLLCEGPRPGLAERARGHGFHGCVPVGSAAETLARAVRALADGREWYPAPLADAAPAAPSHAPLTPREAEIVGQLREGLSNKEIAGRLGIREDTVKKHLQSVFAKLGVHRRTRLVVAPA